MMGSIDLSFINVVELLPCFRSTLHLDTLTVIMMQYFLAQLIVSSKNAKTEKERKFQNNKK